MDTLTKINIMFGMSGILGLMSLGVSYKLSVELQIYKNKYENLLNDYSKLKNQCVIDNSVYRSKINELLKRSVKSPKVVYIPKVINREITVENESCKNMAYLIDEYLTDEDSEEAIK